MSTESVEEYNKISTTAKLVANLRALTDIPFAREIAAASGAEKDFQALAGESAESMKRIAFIWEARYKATDQIIADYAIKQVLEIAAGLSPRGLAMTEDPDVVYVATDLPQILEQERVIVESLLAKLNTTRPNLHFWAVNALERNNLLHAASPFQYGSPIAVITEGLLPYFTRVEKRTLADNIHDLLTRYDGIWITPDVATKHLRKQFLQADDQVQQRMTNIADATGRDLEENAFEDENEVRQFFTDAGFAIEEYPHSNVIEELSSVKRADMSRDDVFKITRLVKTLILTV